MASAPILIYTDKTFTDVGAIDSYQMDLSFGRNEQNFEISFRKPILTGGELLYIDGTEYGGIVDVIVGSTDSELTTYRGRTWHGILAGKILSPDSGKDYLVVSGDANTVLASLIDRTNLGAVFTTPGTASGINISNYQFNRFCDAYNGILDMLETNGAKLRMRRDNGKTVLWAESVRVITGEADSDVMDFSLTQNYRKVNHYVCMGEGELKDRLRVDLYANAKGVISQTQSLFGVDEIAVYYDYTTADRSELIKDGTKSLKELQSEGVVETDISGAGDWYVGDVLEARDNRLGISVQSQIVQKIAKVDTGAFVTEYEVGDKGSSSSTVYGTGEGSGGGITYTAGEGINITGSVISAEVTQTELDSVSSQASSAYTLASGLSSDIAAAVQTANTANSTANTASSTASTALETANAANTKADTALEDAAAAITTANTATTTAEEAKAIAEDAASGSFLAAFPVGSYYYTSDTSFNPDTTYGGTWERLTPVGAPVTWHRLT